MSGLEEGLKSNLQVIVGLVLMLKFLEFLSRLSSFEKLKRRSCIEFVGLDMP